MRFLRFVFTLLVLFASSVYAKGVDRFVVKNQEISEIAQMLAQLTGKNLVLDRRVRGRLSIFVKGNLSPKELWDIFSLGLNQLGYTIRFDEKTNTVQIVPISYAKNLPISTKGRFEGEYTLAVLKLKYLTSKEAEKFLKPFLSLRGRIYAVGDRTVAIWDYWRNIKLVQKILEGLDKPDRESVLRVYNLRYTTAANFERVLKTLADAWNNRGGEKVYYSAVPGENAVAVVAPLAFQKRVELLKEKLDGLGEENTPQFFVINLKFTSVDEVEKALNKLFASLKKGNSYTFPSGLKVSFDKSNNAILVYGTKAEYEILKRFISQLDRRRKQVLITATVVETSAQSVLDAGVNWQVLGSNGGVAFGALSREGAYQAMSQGQFVVGALSKNGVSVNIGGSQVFFPDLLFLYTLLEKGQGFNIVSNPKVLTLDNQKATIKVGQQVAFPTGIKYDVNGNPIITYDYRYVGLELDVTPRISTKSLRLVINLKLQEITGYLTNTVGGINYSVPIISTRELNSDVVVQNGQTIIIGGLIDTKTLNSVSKVPLLGDIPLLGNLFKYKHKEKQKTNLFIFITPYVMSSPQQLERIMEEHKKLAMELLKLKKGKKVNRKELQRWLESIDAVKPAPVR